MSTILAFVLDLLLKNMSLMTLGIQSCSIPLEQDTSMKFQIQYMKQQVFI